MARTKSNLILKGVRGKIGDSLVVKQYAHGTVISAMPDMSHVVKSPLQKLYQNRFGEATAYAKSIIYNPIKKAAYAKKLTKGKQVYHAAIQEYMKKLKK